MNNLGYFIVYKSGNYFNTSINKEGDLEIITGKTTGVDSVGIFEYIYDTKSNSLQAPRQLIYNDSPNIRYSSEWIGIKDAYLSAAGELYLIVSGSANYSFTKIIKYSSISSSLPTWVEKISSGSSVNEIIFFDENLFLISGGIFEFDKSNGNLLRIFNTSETPSDLEYKPEFGYVISVGTYWQSTKTKIESFLSDGALNNQFGASGIYERDIYKYNYEFAKNVKLNSNGDVYLLSILGVSGSTANQRFALVKLDSTGVVDSEFGFDGFVYGDYFKYLSGSKIAVQEDGKILIAFYADNRYLVISRYLNDGHIDESFYSSGTLRFDFPNQLGYQVGLDELDKIDINLMSDGILIAAGAYGTTVVLNLDRNGFPKLDFGDDSEGTFEDITSPLLSKINIQAADYLDKKEINLVITFNENVKRGSGNIVIKTVDGLGVSTYAQNSTNVSIAGKTLTIHPDVNLDNSTSYKLEFATDSVQDLAGNEFAGPAIYNFAINSIPSASGFSIKTDEDTAKTGTLAGTDVDGNTLTFAKVTDPSHGTVTINATTGAYTYTPEANYNGSDSFTFKVNDGTVDSAVATVSITIAPITDIAGHIYHWKSHSLLQGVQIADGAITSTTDSNGNFHLNASNPNSDRLTPTLAAQNTGSAIDISDALAALKIAAGRNPNADGSPVSPYQYIAADMNEDGVVTSADALAIYKMALNRTDAPAAKWLFVNEAEDFWNEAINSFTTSRRSVVYDKSLDVNTQQDVNVNLVAVLKGDVNSSWTGAAGTPILDTVSPNYFAELSSRLGSPQSQWGVIV